MRRRFDFPRNGTNGHPENGQDHQEQIANLASVPPIDRYDGERWYPIAEATREQIVHCISVTTVLSYAYPKDPRLLDWMKKQGPMADSIRDAKAAIGTRVDIGTQRIDQGRTLHAKDWGIEEYKALISYLHWFEEKTPKSLAMQKTVFDTRDKIAGTFDKLVEIDGDLRLIEVKKTSGIYPTHMIQAQVYAHLLNLMGIPVKYADVLRLGTRHKSGFEYLEQEYDPTVYERPFMACVELWGHAHDYRDHPIAQEELPESISLPIPTNGEQLRYPLPGTKGKPRPPRRRR